MMQSRPLWHISDICAPQAFRDCNLERHAGPLHPLLTLLCTKFAQSEVLAMWS